MITQLTPRHREIARRLLLGQRQKDITAELGMSEEHLCRLTKSEPFQQHMEELQQQADQGAFDVLQYMKAHAAQAAFAITDILDDDAAPLSLKIRAALEVIRLSGHGQQREQECRPLTFEERLELETKGRPLLWESNTDYITPPYRQGDQ